MSSPVRYPTLVADAGTSIGHGWAPRVFTHSACLGFANMGTAQPMYIGIGTIVLILIIVVVVLLLRGRGV